MVKKFIYTICSHCRFVIERRGDLPLGLVRWLEQFQSFDKVEIEFINRFISACGWKCKISTYYVVEVLNANCEVTYAATGSTYDEAYKLLHHLIPLKMRAQLKNPDFSKDAALIVAEYIKHPHNV